ncbi:hypothetical protein [Streptomyces sp. SID5910]|uniref:hypothetical protein n=1 Tax=Streptomyces sp. SID5910 TaxID=2690312 RepID=UPI001F32FACC|nr:hypothetical protein [Streptomyces sp. SID5910]
MSEAELKSGTWLLRLCGLLTLALNTAEPCWPGATAGPAWTPPSRSWACVVTVAALG